MHIHAKKNNFYYPRLFILEILQKIIWIPENITFQGLADDQKARGAKEKTIGGLQATFDKLREEYETCSKALEAAQKRLVNNSFYTD